MEEVECSLWYAMRATYRRELKAKKILDENKVENFIPMRYATKISRTQKKRELVPVIHNLIFVRSKLSVLRQLKTQLPYLQYIVTQTDNVREPVIVPDNQMERFIRVVETYDEELIYMDPSEIRYKKGSRVRILDGILKGQEGVFLKVKGAREKRVVIGIQGVIAVATATVPLEMIEVIA